MPLYTGECSNCGQPVRFRAPTASALHKCPGCGHKVIVSQHKSFLTGCVPQLVVVILLGLGALLAFTYRHMLLDKAKSFLPTSTDATSADSTTRPSAPPPAAKPSGQSQPAPQASTTDRPAQSNPAIQMSAARSALQAAEAQLKSATDAASARARNDSRYLTAKKNVDELDARVREARAKNSPELATISQLWIEAKGELAAIEKDLADSLANDPQVLAARKLVDARRQELKQLEERTPR